MVLLVSCAGTKQKSTLDLSKLKPGTYAFFAYKVEGVPSNTSCKIVINQLSPQKTLHTYEFPKGNFGLIPLPAGTYSYDNLGCGFEKRHLIKSPFGKRTNTFTIHAGKLNYLGHTTLVFDSNKDLKNQFFQKDHLSSIKEAFTKINPTSFAYNNVISAYTQRPITKEMTQMPLKRSYKLNTKADKSETKRLQSFFKSVQDKITKCAQKEVVENPLKIGELKTVYKVKNSKLNVTNSSIGHVYSDDFVKCTRRSLKSISFSPDYEVKFVMEL